MIEDKEIIEVINRNNGRVGYLIPDLGNLHRTFTPGETKKISMEELRKLSYIPGGRKIIEDCLLIKNAAAARELLGVVEPEYSYTEDDVRKILETGTLDEFLDMLDFAPEGVIELTKQIAVNSELNDVRKRDAIFKKTGFNVNKAIEINKESEKEDEDQPSRTRRAATPKKDEEEAEGRRTLPVYNIVKK